MNLKAIKKLLVLSLIVVSGHSLATVAPSVLPSNANKTWNDVASVSWSTDNGATWGQSVLTVGQNVTFQITLHKKLAGNHYADFVKLWLDKNGDGDFVDANEAILFGKHVVNTTSSNLKGDVPDGGFYKFTTPLTITSGMVGDNWLLARVTCSESLLSAAGVGSSQWSVSDATYNSYFSPTRSYYQGESEFAKFTVRANQVPEPGSLALVGLGLLGMLRLRKTQKSEEQIFPAK